MPTPAGTHGINWGAKLGGGYYAYVSNQHANVMSIIDPDPNGDGDGSDAAVVGQVLLANGSSGAGVTDGTGGQGIKPLPLTHDGWIQKTVSMVGTGRLSAEVEGWIGLLTNDQKNPEGHHHTYTLSLGNPPPPPGGAIPLVAAGFEDGARVDVMVAYHGAERGPCSRSPSGTCLDSLRPLKPLASAVADTTGRAHFHVQPHGPPGARVHLVAVSAGADGAAVQESNTVTVTVP